PAFLGSGGPDDPGGAAYGRGRSRGQGSGGTLRPGPAPRHCRPCASRPPCPALACRPMTQTRHSAPALPERIGGLAAVAANLSWSWNRNARALFRMLDAALWRRTQHNPIELLRRVDPARLSACAADPAFLRLYDAVAAAVAQDGTSAGTWFATSYPESVQRPIASFCAEFGLPAWVP